MKEQAGKSRLDFLAKKFKILVTQSIRHTVGFESGSFTGRQRSKIFRFHFIFDSHHHTIIAASSTIMFVVLKILVLSTKVRGYNMHSITIVPSLLFLLCCSARGFGLGCIPPRGLSNTGVSTVAATTSHQAEHASFSINTSPNTPAKVLDRRGFGATVVGLSAAILPPTHAQAASSTMRDYLREVRDPATYSALAYVDPTVNNKDQKLPLLIVLHGAGKNEKDVWNLADPRGEHAGLIPSLIATNQAPKALTDNFAVVAPYAAGKRSFYEEPRSKLLQFVEWVCSDKGREAGCPVNIDPNRVFLFGFSDGATVAVELATTRRFRGAIICAYGYSGILPDLALERLNGIPFWIFHSADDVIFPVRYGDQLAASLRSVSTPPGLVRYTRYDVDQEGFTGDVKGHSVGITASKMADIYTWMLSIP